MPQTDWENLSKSGDARRRAGEPAKVRKARAATAKAAAKAATEAQAAKVEAKATAKADRFAYLTPTTAQDGAKADGGANA